MATQRIKNYLMNSPQLEAGSMRFLWLELVIFSTIYGLMFKSWPVGIGLFVGIAFLLNRPKGAIYTVCALSFLWAFVFAAIGFGFAGWIGALILGGMVFWTGVSRHMSELNWTTENIQPEEPLAWNRPNLN